MKKMLNIPEKISIANLPTRIEFLERFSKELNGPNIFIKRDDYTGTEISGNKVRKLEFSVKEAIDKNCNTLITCGGIQSNHCRATAAIAAKLGLKCYLILRGSDTNSYDGNLFLDKLLGANIKFISPEDYKFNRSEIMESIKENLIKDGLKPYIIPEGASNGIGSFGYFLAMEEIAKQEEELGLQFDHIVLSVGSGGTYAGLLLCNKYLNHQSKVWGINICDDKDYFKNRIYSILGDCSNYLDISVNLSIDDINIIDGYVGKGYALSSPVELDFIKKLAKLEGIILDPVYTGKAMYGLQEEIKKGLFKKGENVLFIHTGGLYGLFPQKDYMEFV